MTYLVTNRGGGSKIYKKLWGPTILGLVLLGVFYFGRSFLQELVVNAAHPILSSKNSVLRSINTASRYFIPDGILEKENLALKEEVSRLQNLIIENRILRAENEDLRKKVSYLEEGNFVAASIFLMPPATPYDTILLNKGSSDGVSAGSKAVLGDRVALGVVEDLWQKQSSIKLYSYSGLKTAVMLERTGAFLEVEGNGGGNFKLETPIDFDIQEGDIVLLTDVPRRAIAIVAGIDRNESTSFLTAYLRVLVPLSASMPVYIEKSQ